MDVLPRNTLSTNSLFYQVMVKRDGYADTEVSPYLTHLQVEESDHEVDLASLTLQDSGLVQSEMAILQPGSLVEIDLGYQDAHTLIFRGYITSIRSTMMAQGEPQLAIQAMDSLIRLGLNPKTRSWRNTTVSQIVRDIASASGFQPDDIDPAEDAALQDPLRPYSQIEETDLALLLRLGQDYDSRLYVEHRDNFDTLNFVSTRKLLEAKPIEESLGFNSNMAEFSPSIDAFAAIPEQRLVTTDPRTGEVVTVTQNLVQPADTEWEPDLARLARIGAEVTGGISKSISSSPMFWQQPPRKVGVAARDVSDRAGTFGDWSRRLGQTAQGRARGSMWLRPRRRVRIEGCGGRWSGDWYLAQVQHQMNVRNRDYSCSFSCTR